MEGLRRDAVLCDRWAGPRVNRGSTLPDLEEHVIYFFGTRVLGMLRGITWVPLVMIPESSPCASKKV
jgi:hypothetical protein